MNIRGFHHLAIQVRALEQVTAFYRDVLGLPEVARHRRPDGSLRSVWVALPEGFLALEETPREAVPAPFRDEQPGLFLLALRIEPGERGRVREALARKGVPIVHESRWTLYIQDPEGNRVGLSHHPEDAEEPKTV